MPIVYTVRLRTRMLRLILKKILALTFVVEVLKLPICFAHLDPIFSQARCLWYPGYLFDHLRLTLP